QAAAQRQACARPGKGSGARIAASGAPRARSSTRRDDQRAPPRADYAGDRGDRSPDEGDERAHRIVSHARAVHRYHDGTKHHFTRVARSLGYLDWASQPNPFRSFRGAPSVSLQPAISHQPSTIAGVLRLSLGLSAWKQFGQSRWSLRVNPSSGNLHPTEAYVIVGGENGRVSHYAPDRHALDQRCAFDAPNWCQSAVPSTFLVALTSIHWREAWKYGERAFRYCQHDLGHAIAAVRIAASLHGLQARILPDWSHADMCALTGIDRDEDYVDAEREEPGCVLLIGEGSEIVWREHLIAWIRRGRWMGRASQLS